MDVLLLNVMGSAAVASAAVAAVMANRLSKELAGLQVGDRIPDRAKQCQFHR